jgi:hypothetical protein
MSRIVRESSTVRTVVGIGLPPTIVKCFFFYAKNFESQQQVIGTILDLQTMPGCRPGTLRGKQNLQTMDAKPLNLRSINPQRIAAFFQNFPQKRRARIQIKHWRQAYCPGRIVIL